MLTPFAFRALGTAALVGLLGLSPAFPLDTEPEPQPPLPREWTIDEYRTLVEATLPPVIPPDLLTAAPGPDWLAGLTVEAVQEACADPAPLAETYEDARYRAGWDPDNSRRVKIDLWRQSVRYSSRARSFDYETSPQTAVPEPLALSETLAVLDGIGLPAAERGPLRVDTVMGQDAEDDVWNPPFDRERLISVKREVNGFPVFESRARVVVSNFAERARLLARWPRFELRGGLSLLPRPEIVESIAQRLLDSEEGAEVELEIRLGYLPQGEASPDETRFLPVARVAFSDTQSGEIAYLPLVATPPDEDSDGVADAMDNCPDRSNPLQEDADADGHGNACDNCPDEFNPGQEDADADGVGDACQHVEGACCAASADSLCDTMAGSECAAIEGRYLGDGTACLGDADDDQIDDACDNCSGHSNPGQENGDVATIRNGGFESPPSAGAAPDDFDPFVKHYRGGGVGEADSTCTGAATDGHVVSDYYREDGQALYLYAYSGDPASTGAACHRESGMRTLGTYDLTDRTALSAWITDFSHSSASTCENSRTQFRLDDGSSSAYVDLFNVGQYVPIPPGYDSYVESAVGADGRTWRRFEAALPAEWAKPGVNVTILTSARSWCSGWTVYSRLYVDTIEFLPRGDAHGDACDNCPLVYNPDQSDGEALPNHDFELPADEETVPDDFESFAKHYRGASVGEADSTCTGADLAARIETDASLDGEQAVYLYAYSGDPAATGAPCHRESGVRTAGKRDLRGRSTLSVWVTGFEHSSASTCEHARTQFRLEDDSGSTYMDLFNVGQYVPIPPSYADYVETATGTDEATWRRFEAAIPVEWQRRDVQITVLTTVRSWCAGWTVHSVLFVDGLELLPAGDGYGDACDNCATLPNDQTNSDTDAAGDACDCATADATAHDLPHEILGLHVATDRTTLTWSSDARNSGSGTTYDVVRGLLSELPVGSGASEICLEASSEDTTAVDTELPAEGAGFYYVVHGSNACGSGSFGHDSSGAARSTDVCTGL